MPIENPENWYLKKHEDGEIFGPVRFDKVQEWAQSAQINPQDLLSNDQQLWTRPPMVPELGMDWLVELGENLLYGPTTSGTLLEFAKSGEISVTTRIINCVDGTEFQLRETEFFKEAQAAPPQDLPEQPRGAGFFQQPLKGGIRANLQKRVRELEQSLLEKQRLLSASKDIIARLEAKNKELESKVRELGRPSTKP